TARPLISRRAAAVAARLRRESLRSPRVDAHPSAGMATALTATGGTSRSHRGRRPRGRWRRGDAPTIDARPSPGDIRGGIMHSRLRYVVILVLSVAVAKVGWATCSVDSQLTNLAEAPTQCSPSQLGRLERVLNNRLQFRETLDLPLATKI